MNLLEKPLGRRVVVSRLEPFGFEAEGNLFFYRREIPGTGLDLTVILSADGEMSTKVTDAATGEPYTLYLSPNSVGSFVGKVRSAIEDTLAEIADQCCETDVFRFSQTKEIIEYSGRKYGTSPEYLWKKFPANAVLRRQDNQKWYAALLTVAARKLGLQDGGDVEIVDLRIDPAQTAALLDGKRYFPAWHMNKKSWYTIVLDGTVSNEELFERLDESYRLAAKK